MSELNQSQLRTLYFDYVQYRDSLSSGDPQDSVNDFFKLRKHRYVK